MQDTRSAQTGETSSRQPLVGWLTVGIAGVGLLFVASVHFLNAPKVPGLFLGLGAVAGVGLGFWGKVMSIQPTWAIAIAAWLAISGGEVLSTVKENHDRVAYLRTRPENQDSPADPITEGLKRALEVEPAVLTDQQRRQQMRSASILEAGESRRRERLAKVQEKLTFYGFLHERIPEAWGKWRHPWPAVFWGAEVVLGSTLGAWLAIITLRNTLPRNPAG